MTVVAGHESSYLGSRWQSGVRCVVRRGRSSSPLAAGTGARGGLVALIMWLLTTGDREAQHEAEARQRLAVLEVEEEELRKAA